MSSWINSSFSEAITMEFESSLWSSEARGLRIRVRRGRRRPRGVASFQNLVPIPRNISETASSRIRVPAPTIMIMDFMVN